MSGDPVFEVAGTEKGEFCAGSELCDSPATVRKRGAPDENGDTLELSGGAGFIRGTLSKAAADERDWASCVGSVICWPSWGFDDCWNMLRKENAIALRRVAGSDSFVENEYKSSYFNKFLDFEIICLIEARYQDKLVGCARGFVDNFTAFAFGSPSAIPLP